MNLPIFRKMLWTLRMRDRMSNNKMQKTGAEVGFYPEISARF